MKVDLQTGDLFTDSGDHLKTLFCPLRKQLDEMKGSARNFYCDSCNMKVHNTEAMTDCEIQQLLNDNPEACLVISLEQSNCTILHGSMQNRLMFSSGKSADDAVNVSAGTAKDRVVPSDRIRVGLGCSKDLD